MIATASVATKRRFILTEGERFDAYVKSLQNPDASYGQVMQRVLENLPEAEIMDCVTDGAATGSFLLQYEESGWEFLVRLASCFGTFLVPDCRAEHGRAYFRIPELQYDAFGNELETAGQLPNRIRYTGQQYDDVTGQYYLRARYYNPVLGRFMQEDTYQGDGLNLYAYCKNNPVTYYDPSGYACGDLGIFAGDGGEGGINFIDDIALMHSSVGDFTYNPKTGQISKMKGGGHGQSNIDFLKKNGIEFRIIKEYANGVRVGNVPGHKTPSKRTGTGQAWFPQNWSDSKIKDAGNFVANLPENKNLPNGVTGFGEYDGVRVGIIKTDGKIGTIFPDADLQP